MKDSIFICSIYNTLRLYFDYPQTEIPLGQIPSFSRRGEGAVAGTFFIFKGATLCMLNDSKSASQLFRSAKLQYEFAFYLTSKPHKNFKYEHLYDAPTIK